VPGGHQYWDAVGRLTYAPILTEDSLLHLGGSVRYQDPNDATTANDDRVLQPGSTLKTEANILGENLLGTQPLTCAASASTQLVGENCVKDVVQYGAEAVGAYGPFSVQGDAFREPRLLRRASWSDAVRPPPTLRPHAGFLASFRVRHPCRSPGHKFPHIGLTPPEGAEGPARRKSNAPEP